MQTVSANTKISAILKANPNAIDAIASINPHFKKLQNPFLRKFLAPRVTVAEAARIGKCNLHDFFEKLKSLGFIIDYGTEAHPRMQETPAESLGFDVQLDVRADIESGNDPFKKIMMAVGDLPVGSVLLLINSFEPVPLIRILTDKGFNVHTRTINPDEVHTFIGRTPESKVSANASDSSVATFDKVKATFAGKMTSIDVRQLPMPQPMMKILSALDALESDDALFVHHKKVPMFLLPELRERGFEQVLRHVAEGVELIIYRDKDNHDTA